MFSVRTSAAYALSQSGAEAKAFVLFILTTTQLMANWLARSQLIHRNETGSTNEDTARHPQSS